MMLRAALAVPFVMACRLAGPEGSPTALIDVDAGASIEEPSALPEGPEQNAATDGSEASSPTGGAEEGGATNGGEEGNAAPEPALPAPPDSSPVSCVAPAGLICEPVTGTGCLPLMQCVVDPAASAAAAYCVFSGAPLDMSCTQDPFATSCPPQHTCIAGECREYCYCDADCQSGAACADPSGQGGSDAFRLCARIAP